MRSFSLGVWIIVAVALVSSVLVILRPREEDAGLQIWTFSWAHVLIYNPIIDEWNAQRPEEERVAIDQFALAALEHRMLSGFFAGVPTADLIEVERSIAGRAFTGPLESVGFTDLTDRMREEGLIDIINPPSFAPWMSRGRIFGIPHDVHPVLLGYRVDLVEEVGIDVSRIETWDDFKREMRPLVVDLDGDGTIDRYPLAFWPSELDKLELLFLQGGGRMFAEDGSAQIATELHAELLAEMVSWCVGPDRIAGEAPDFSASGNALKIRGFTASFFMPDWMCDLWQNELPGMAGKLRLMPLPAWEPGGRRTSVWGGTMLAIPKDVPDFEKAWEFAKHLYLSDEMARRLYRDGDIISPIETHWDDPVYDEPDPYFGGQAKGRLYIEMAPHIPVRESSPYFRRAMERIADAGLRLLAWANANGVYDAESLRPEALRQLGEVEAIIERQMERTAAFHELDAAGGVDGEGG